MKKAKVADWDALEPLTPAYALVANVDLVVIRSPGEESRVSPAPAARPAQESRISPAPTARPAQEKATVLYGRCLHRGALLADGRIQGEDLLCGVHGWDYRYKTGISYGGVSLD